MLSIVCWLDELKKSYMKLSIHSGANIQIPIVRMIHLTVNEFIRNSKDISDGNSHLWHQKQSLPCTKVIGFVVCRVTSKTIGIGSAECSWGDVKKSNQERDQLLAVTYMRIRVLCIHLLVFKK